MHTERLNFSWLIIGEIAGHEAPGSPGDIQFLKDLGIKALVRMEEKHKTKVTSQQLTNMGLVDCHEPLEDFTAPSKAQIDKIISFIEQSVAEGKPVGVSCHAGYGRTGTILACYLVRRCYTADQAMTEVRKKRPGSIENKVQEDAIKEYANRLGKL